MFAPEFAKAPTAVNKGPTGKLNPQRPTLAAQAFSGGAADHAQMLQRNLGNQGALRLLSQRISRLTGSEFGGDHEPESSPENMTAQEAPRGTVGNFRKMLLSDPGKPNGRQAGPPLTAPWRPGILQTKLIVGEIDHPLEHEANHVADQVMRMGNSEPSMGAIPLQVSRRCTVSEDETKTARSKPAELGDPAASETPSLVLDVLRSPARPLDPAVRAQFEPQIGYDLGQVRVHTDGPSARSAAAVGARAYTVGRDVVFGANQYAPETGPGKRLLAHELVHVAQQGAPAAAYAPGVTLSGDTAPMRGPQRSATGILQRQPEQEPRSSETTIDPTRRKLLPDEKTRIDRFLQQHQVVLLLRENRAWLDGQQTSVDQVIARVRREAQVLLPDDDVIASYIDAQFYQYLPGRGAPASAGSAGLEPPSALLEPAIPVPFGLDPGNLLLKPQLSFADASRIRNYLATNGLAVGPGLVPVFGGSQSTLDQIVEGSRALVLPIIPREQVAGVVEVEWSRLVLQALRLPLPPPPPFTIPLVDVPPATAEAPEELQSAIGWQGTWHLRQSGRAENTIQVQLTQGGGAIQHVYQFQVNVTTGDVQAMAGAQVQSPEATLVDTRLFHAIHAVVKASAFLQLVGGITNAGGTAASGSLTVQLQAGVQISATLGPVNVTVQAGPTLTLQQGQAAGVDFNPAVQSGMAKLPQGEFPPFYGIPLIQGRF